MDPAQYGGWYILSPQSWTEGMDSLSFTQISKPVVAHWADIRELATSYMIS